MTAREILKSTTHYPMRCTGCYEQGEMGGRVYAGRFHKGLKMMVGIGCEECNHRGWTAERGYTQEEYTKAMQGLQQKIEG